MSEWWTYRLSDLLMFSKASYFRLFELQNLALWPFQLLALGIGIALLICLAQGGARAGRSAALLLALAWLHVAWNYFAQRYATINTGAPGFAIGFALQAVLLFRLASRNKEPRLRQPAGALGKLGLAIALIALFGYPLLAPLGGRPWASAELFGLAPDPTVALSCAALLLWRAGPMLWIVPLLWCAISTATLVELHADQAWVLPVLASLAAGARLLSACRSRRWVPNGIACCISAKAYILAILVAKMLALLPKVIAMQNTRLQHIDVWRFFAIFLVLVCHVVAHSHPWYKETIPGLLWRLQPNGTVGVQIFFCISGFVICRGLVREHLVSGAISMRGFFIRRAYRILPPLLMFIAAVAFLTALGLFDLTSLQFSRAVLFLCNMRPLGNCGWALGHTWSLAYEEQFYLIFPVLLVSLGLLANRHRILAVLGGLAALFLFAKLSDESSFLGTYVSNFLYLLAGCVCALYWKKLQPRLQRMPFAAWLLVALSLVGLNAIALPAAVRSYVYPLVFPVLVCVAVFGTPIHRPIVQAVFLNPRLAHLGRISYGIYLWQQLATYDYGFSSPLVALVLVAASVALAHYSFNHVELPLIALGAQQSAVKPEAAAPASPAVDEDMEKEMQQGAG